MGNSLLLKPIIWQINLLQLWHIGEELRNWPWNSYWTTNYCPNQALPSICFILMEEGICPHIWLLLSLVYIIFERFFPSWLMVIMLHVIILPISEISLYIRLRWILSSKLRAKHESEAGVERRSGCSFECQCRNDSVEMKMSYHLMWCIGVAGRRQFPKSELGISKSLARRASFDAATNF